MKNTSTSEQTVALSSDFIFMDKIAGAKVMVKDEMEGFFDKITKTDMEIQMKETFEGSREALFPLYKKHIQESVLEFSNEEKKVIGKIMAEAKALCDSIDPKIFPGPIWLLKTNGNHYGAGAYYTRENGIIIPEDKLPPEEDFMFTMLHEIFHIYSRINPEKKKELYERIGFKKINPPEIPKTLSEKILLNPDGIDFNYAISITENEETYRAIPIIYAQSKYQKGKNAFFSYLKFELFRLAEKNGNVSVVINPNGSSTIDLKKLSSFFLQIGDNTDYIIHPDEVLADNFAILALSYKDSGDSRKLSESGKKLQDDIKNILKN